MQYILDKAIDLYKINRLTSKEKKELFEQIVVHPHGSYYANRMLIECPHLISEDQRNLLIKILMRNSDTAAKYFLDGKMNKEEREQLFSVIINNLYAITLILNTCHYTHSDKQCFSAKELALIIKNFKVCDEYKGENKEFYDDAVEAILSYIGDHYRGQHELKNKFFLVMLENVNFLNTIIFKLQRTYFNNEQKKDIYAKHSQKIFNSCKRSLKNLVIYCSYFKNFIIYQEKAVLVEKIIIENDYYLARQYLDKNSPHYKNIDLPPDLIEQLTALLLMRELTKD